MPTQVTEDSQGVWNIRRTTTVFFKLVKLRAVDFKFKIGEEFDEVTPDKRDVRYYTHRGRGSRVTT